MVSGEILFRIRNTPLKRWRDEGYLVKFSPCGLGAELIMQNSTDRNHWGGTIGWSSWSWTWPWPWLYWSPCWWLWWLWGDYAEQQWPQPFGRRGNNRSISDPHFIKPVQAENVLEQRKYLYLQSGHFAAKLQFMVWGSGAPGAPGAPGLPGLPGLRAPRWLVGDVQQKWDGLLCKR